MPLDLIRRTTGAAEHSDQNREQNAWLRDHGINPGDWSKVYPVLVASKRHHRRDPASRAQVRPDALERARLMRVSDLDGDAR